MTFNNAIHRPKKRDDQLFLAQNNGVRFLYCCCLFVCLENNNRMLNR